MTVLLAAFFLLSGCAETPPTKPVAETKPDTTYTNVTWADVPGFTQDNLTEVLPALHQHCAAWARRSNADAAAWLRPCAALPPMGAATTNKNIQDWLMQFFAPQLVSEGDAQKTENTLGLFTGYYEPQITASLAHGGNFQHPIYARPADLVRVDLSAFGDDFAGKKIWGQLIGSETDLSLQPYPTRENISTTGLPKAQIIAYTDDPIGLFVLHIQGSGQLKFPDGKIQRIGYAAQNGHAYVALGKVLREAGMLEPPIDMPKIRAFLAQQNPADLQKWLNENPSYIFFQTNHGEGPVGSWNIPLTPGRSMAVDVKSIPLGSLVWLDTPHPDPARPALQRLMLAQDTGGAIKGSVRGDVFWGAGQDAENFAGIMQSRGRYFILKPR